ncbi:VOC family protein [Nocardia miyunensis]|uniref:VOC family protein n=1 Tax=Nocardia miyunensis TaxID=282684 RepID=UPI00082E53FB|nr:VOC family protein [Nocardia miyunensis]
MTTAAVKELNHVAIGVRDLDASLRFYTEGLGLRKTLEKPVSDLTWRLMRLPENTTGLSVFVQGPSRVGQLELVKWDLPEPEGDAPKSPGRMGYGQLSFPVDPEHIHTIYERLVSMGYDVYSEPTTTIVKNYGPVTLFLCEDPDGNQIELIALPPADVVKEFRAKLLAEQQNS